MTDFETFSPEQEDDEKDQRLLRDLHRFYSVEGRDPEFFVRLYTRLQERSASLPQDHGEEHNLEPFPPPKPHQSGRRRFGSSGETLWRQRLSTLAAAVCVTVLVSALVIVLDHAHQNSAGTSRTVLQAIGVISSLQMMDAQMGWALTDKEHLVRTVDGGGHWHDVSPQALLHAVPTSIVTDFLTASLAWVAFSSSDDETTRIFQTSDSGQMWRETTVPTGVVAQITFLNPQVGWLLSKHAVSENAETAEIFRTTNGGKTWTSIATVLASSADLPAPGHLPFSGKKTGMSFLNAMSGWMAGSVPVNGSTLLYRTNDGGTTWSPQSLELSADEQSALLSITQPVFFSPTEGILPVSANTGSSTQLTFYVTQNGGTSWQRTTAVMATVWDVLDSKHGWASDGTHLSATSDGGQHWMQLSSPQSLHSLSHLDFVSSDMGWAIGSVQTAGPSLLKTTDGGRTWIVIPSLMV